MSFSALSNNDKVGMLLFSDKTEVYSPPRKGKKNALKIIRDILYYQAENKTTNLEIAIKQIWSLCKKKSIIFILSDFISEGYEQSLKILARKHDVIALKINDPAESQLPASGLMHFQDPETGELFSVNTSNKKLRKRYYDEIKSRDITINELFKKSNIDTLTLYTDKPYIYDLIKFFKARIKKRR